MIYHIGDTDRAWTCGKYFQPFLTHRVLKSVLGSEKAENDLESLERSLDSEANLKVIKSSNSEIYEFIPNIIDYYPKNINK